MDILHWISGSDVRDDNVEGFDCMYLLPIAVGLGSIAVSIFILRRHSVFCNDFMGSITNRLNKRKKVNHATAPKSKHKPSVKAVTGHNVNVTHPPADTPISQTNSFTANVQDQQKELSEHNHNDSNQKVDNGDRKSLKKAKKSRRSTKPTDEDVQDTGVVDSDSAWVLVTSKRSKHSSESKTSSRISNQSISKGNRVNDNPVSDNPSPSSSVNEATMLITPDNLSAKQSKLKPTLKPAHNSVTTSVSPTPVVATRLIPTQHSHNDHPEQIKRGETSNSSPSSTLKQNTVSHQTPEKMNDNLPATQSAQMMIHVKIPNSNMPTHQNPPQQLTSVRELMAQHTMAELQAKEAVCQLLRNEVLQLREEVKNLKNSHSSSSSSSTFNPTPESEHKLVGADLLTTNESPNRANCTQNKNESDNVLVGPLQAEIARLAVETTTYKQRCENLKARLDLSNKKLSDTKSKSTDQMRLLQSQLDAQSGRVSQLEQELQDALQKAEMHRRKMDESEHTTKQRSDELERIRFEQVNLHSNYELLERKYTLNVEEQEHTKHKYDELVSTHSATFNELNTTLNQCANLQHQLTNCEEQLYKLQKQHQSDRTDASNNLHQFELLLAEQKSRTQLDQSKISNLESQLGEMNTQIDQLKIDLDCYETKMVHIQQQQNQPLVQKPDSHDQCIQTMETKVEISKVDQCCETADLSNESETLTTNPTNTTATKQFIDRAVNTITGQNNTNTSDVKHVQTGDDDIIDVHSNSDKSEVVIQLKSEIYQYKSALDVTETILSKLQNSVDEEETRWRRALDAVKCENEMLKEKSSKLEAALNAVVHDRAKRQKGIEQRLNDANIYSNSNSTDVEEDPTKMFNHTSTTTTTAAVDVADAVFSDLAPTLTTNGVVHHHHHHQQQQPDAE